jgi:ketosteroid isomerase-like protein
MKNVWKGLAAVLVLAGCATGSNVPQDAVPAELATAVPAMHAAWQSDNVAAFETLYADNIEVMTVEDRYTGWSEVRARWLSALPNITDFTTSRHRFTRKGNEIYESGDYAFKLTENGNTSERRGTYVQQWQLQADGSWRVVKLNVQ